MALIPVFYTASTKDIAEKSHEQGILKYPGICWIQDIETVVYVSSDNELHYAKGNEQIDKVIGAVSGHLPTLNDDGSLVDSGKSPDDFDEAGAAASALADAKSYINKKISELINGAPETADTLKELSDLVSQNKDIITSLDTLLSKKADITAIPTTLPNPNALTFSGLVEGNYDGSEAVNIEVPQDMWIHVTIDSSNYVDHISERDTTFEEIDNYYTSHPSNNIFMSCLIDNIECIGTLESASPGDSYTFGVMSCPAVDATVNGITKKSITIYKSDGYDIDNNILNIPYVNVGGDITFEKAVCKLLVKANIGYVIRPGSYDGGDYYLVIKTNFDRGRGGCLVYDRYGTFKSYRYTLMNGEEWTITPTSSPNIISITTKNGKYYSSHNFNEIKKINPENMLVCYNNAYGRLVSMDDNEAVFKILKSTVVFFDVYIRINSDDSVEVKPEIPYASLNKSNDNTYTLDLSEAFMNDEFTIMYYDDVTQSSYLGKAYKGINDETIFRIWLSETEIMDVTVNLSEINDDTDLSAVPVTVEKKSIVPAALPNPNKLTLSGLVTAEYDGSSDVSVEIPEPYPYFTIGKDTEFAKAVCTITQKYDFGFIYDSRFDRMYAVIKIDFSRGTGTAYVSDPNSGFVKYFTNSQTNTIEKSTDVIKNPNPNKLILTGGAEAEYDGTSEVTVDIPEPIIFDVRAVSNGGGVSSHLETDVTYNELYTKAQSTPHIYARYLGELYPLFEVDNLSSPNTLEFAGIDKKIVIDANNSITEEDIVYNSALRVTVIKKNSAYTVQDVTSKDFIDRFISNFVLIGLDDQDVDSQPVQVFQVNLTDIKMGEVSYFEYTCMNYNIIIKFTFKIDQKNIDNPPTVTVEQKPIVPAALPNPNKLTFEGAVTAEYDGSSEVSVDIPPADLVVTVTATSNDEYQSDTTFEQIRNASGDVRLILKGGTDVPDLHGNLIILHNDGAIFKVTSNPSTNGYIIIDTKNTVHIEHYCNTYAVQISKLNNNKYVCNNTTFEDLLEIINTTSNVIVEYNGYVGYLETQPTSETTAIAFNVIKDDAIVRILIDNTDNVTVKETPLGSNSFIVKVTHTSSNNDTTYSSDHSFSEIKEAYDKGLNPIVIYDNYAICQMVCINLLEAKFVSPSSSVESYNITIDKNNVAVDEFNIITSDKVIPDLDRVLDTMDPIYPSSYPVSAQAIGKLRDSIKESIPTKLSQLESRDYNSLENKPIVSINDLIDGDKFTYTETKPNAQGFVTRTYKFIINPDLDFNDRLFRVDVPDNVGNIMILIVTKKTDGSDYLTYYITGAGNGEILAINTDKANKMMVVNRVFTGSRMLIEFDDTGCYKNSTSYFSVYKSDVLTKTNTVEFTPEKDYHPATKKYVDDAIAALKAELTGSTGESTETE